MLAATWPTTSLSMPLHDDPGLDRHLEGDAFGRLDDHRVAEPEGQAQRVGALGLGAVADADDLEFLAEPVGDTDDHVVDEGAGEAVQRPVLALVVGTLDHEQCRRR